MSGGPAHGGQGARCDHAAAAQEFAGVSDVPLEQSMGGMNFGGGGGKGGKGSSMNFGGGGDDDL